MSGPPPGVERDVLAAVDDEATAALLARLVEVPSENPPGDEGDLVAELERELRSEGIDPILDEVLPGRPNLEAHLGDGDGPVLLLNGHTDTMPAGDGWSVPPHGAAIRDGRLYGVGSCDMKAGLASMVAAMRAVKRTAVRLRGRVILDAVVDEEARGSGTKRTVARGRRADWAIIAEPTGLEIAPLGNGQINVEMVFHGRAGHGSTPELGHNAIYDAAAFIAEVEAENARLSAHPHPLIGPASYSVGRTDGGLRTSIIPSSCRVGVDRRLLPGQTLGDAQTDLERLLDRALAGRPDARAEWTVTVEYPPFEVPRTLPVFRTLVGAVQDVTGEEAVVRGLRATTDAAFLAAGGIPAVVFGPGNLQQAHGPDEYVELEQVHAATRTFALTIVRLIA
jgi:acetylornithine deacetylase/succinyl-diaminopimelate desuccinylase family protein